MTTPARRRRAQSNIVGGLIHLLAEVGTVVAMLGLLSLIAFVLVTIL